MRTLVDKARIESNLSEPFSLENFLSQDEINFLIDYYETDDKKIHKNTGPVTSRELRDEFNTVPELIAIFDRIKSYIGECGIYTSFMFHTNTAHLIHNDDDKLFPLTYKAITIPLRIEYELEDTGHPDLCIFDQYYLEGPSKFFNGARGITSYYNVPVYDYFQVCNKSKNRISLEIYNKYFTHLRPRWLEGLSINSIHTWKPGNAIFFDAVRLHCASNFPSMGIKKKLGLSIFTAIPR
jgi:hypothetical protein